MAVRFILGMCEGGLLPGIVSDIVITTWLRPDGDSAGIVPEYHLQTSRTSIPVSRSPLE